VCTQRRSKMERCTKTASLFPRKVEAIEKQGHNIWWANAKKWCVTSAASLAHSRLPLYLHSQPGRTITLRRRRLLYRKLILARAFFVAATVQNASCRPKRALELERHPPALPLRSTKEFNGRIQGHRHTFKNSHTLTTLCSRICCPWSGKA